MLQKKRLTAEQALASIKQYCAYQERSHKEVKEKLYSFGLWKNEVEQLLARLIEDDYLNEERFAKSFAGGKFRMKQWGRVKIKYELKLRGVSEYNIRRGMNEISETDYMATFQKLFDKKMSALRGEKNIQTKKRKLSDFMLQKGYERELIMHEINQL